MIKNKKTSITATKILAKKLGVLSKIFLKIINFLLKKVEYCAIMVL
jgi:hypothetical protein